MKIDILFWCIIVYIVTYSFSLRLKLKDTLQNDNEEYLFTINFISMPFTYPNISMNINSTDPFGNIYPSNIYSKGEISLIGIKQIKEIAKKIKTHFESVSRRLIKESEINNLCPCFKLCIQSSKALSNYLLRNYTKYYEDIKDEYDYLKDITYDHKLIENASKENKTEQFMNKYFTKGKQIISKYLKYEKFEIDNKHFLFFNRTNLTFSNMDLLIDYYLNYESLKEKIIKAPSFNTTDIKSFLFYPEDNLFDIKAYKAFYIINSDKNFTLSYLKKIENLLNDLSSRVYLPSSKLINLFIPDYIYSGIYYSLVTNLLDISDLPGVSYGNIITLDAYRISNSTIVFRETVNDNYIKNLSLFDMKANLNNIK